MWRCQWLPAFEHGTLTKRAAAGHDDPCGDDQKSARQECVPERTRTVLRRRVSGYPRDLVVDSGSNDWLMSIVDVSALRAETAFVSDFVAENLALSFNNQARPCTI